MKLSQLLKSLRGVRFDGNETISITDVAYHTKDVTPGCCFVAIHGLKTDGHQYIAKACAQGARAVLVEQDVSVPRGVAKIKVGDTRDALARLSAHFFGEPTLELRLVGITGTNGKTTTAALLHHLMSQGGFPSGLISTVAMEWGAQKCEANRTTPESCDLQKTFREMVDCGVKNCFMEVTSHALELKRVVGCHFDGAVFLNLSEDHLDFHDGMENYFAAKAKLFRERLVVSEKKKLWAVVNKDDPYGRTLIGGLGAKVWTFSLEGKADVSGSEYQTSWEGLRFRVHFPNGSCTLTSKLKGQFNGYNILAATAAALAMELPMETIQAGIASFGGVPGRLEEIKNNKGFKIIVDYAHTPAALENVLQTLRGLGEQRILTVFGCGGNRDRTKRPLMGKIAAQLSDQVVVTSDNPRDEKPEAIMDEILTGIKRREEVSSVCDRKEAIALAFKLAKPGDCILIAGKGHETYQETAGVKRHFDDREVVRELLE